MKAPSRNHIFSHITSKSTVQAALGLPPPRQSIVNIATTGKEAADTSALTLMLGTEESQQDGMVVVDQPEPGVRDSIASGHSRGLSMFTRVKVSQPSKEAALFDQP